MDEAGPELNIDMLCWTGSETEKEKRLQILKSHGVCFAFGPSPEISCCGTFVLYVNAIVEVF